MKYVVRIGTFLLLLCLLVVPVSAQASAMPGLDVSVWQGEIDFAQVKAAGRSVVYIRAGEGLFEDRRFQENARHAREAGMKVGFYFFVTAADAAQARQQAEYFAELIRHVPYDCRPAVDFEQYGHLSQPILNQIAQTFARTLEEKTGIVPLFYTNVSSVETIWEESLTRYPLWIAEYGPSEPSSLGHWRTWAGFQYRDNGRVPGIQGPVDLDWFTDQVLLEGSRSWPFADVTRRDWYYGGVKSLYDQGLLQGVSRHRFAPDAPAQRAAAVTVLYRAAGKPAVSGPTGFSDVPASAWFAKAVRWAEERGIAQGDAPQRFSPDRGVSRQELALFLFRDALARGASANQRASLSLYADGSQVSPWAREAVSWAVAEGILTGTGPKTLAPRAQADRAQLAVMVHRYLVRYGDSSAA